MQNRSNRNLLFGARATAGGDATSSNNVEADTLEMENQRAVEQLRGSAGSIKDIALHIDGEVSDQNRMLDRMDKRFDNSNSLLAQTTQLLNEMVSDRTSSRTCFFVAVFFVALVILFWLLKK